MPYDNNEFDIVNVCLRINYVVSLMAPFDLLQGLYSMEQALVGDSTVSVIFFMYSVCVDLHSLCVS